MAAMLTGLPAIALQDHEAQMLGTALFDVAAHYNIALAGPGAVWVKLIAAVGIVYAPRIVTVMQQRQALLNANKGSNVVPGPGSTMTPNMPQGMVFQ